MIEIERDKILDIYENIIRKKTKNKERIYKFDRYKMMNIDKVYKELKNSHYDGGFYNIFLIKDPKYRIIMSLNIKDKLINHYITTYLLYPKLKKD